MRIRIQIAVTSFNNREENQKGRGHENLSFTRKPKAKEIHSDGIG
jgi:hypothetical protein